jgi:tetratricopeptide (TPR) repeat protein
VAAGHLHQAAQAQASLKAFEAATEQLKGGKYAYVAGSTGTRIRHSEIAAWTAFAESKPELALTKMREAADLQDKVGQGEVDIPAREMLADMLLDLHQPGPALIEYEQALKLSPNRFNGLYHAGLAAETLGDKAKAETYYATLLKSTNNGAASTRPEFDHIRKFRGSSSVPSTK